MISPYPYSSGFAIRTYLNNGFVILNSKLCPPSQINHFSICWRGLPHSAGTSASFARLPECYSGQGAKRYMLFSVSVSYSLQFETLFQVQALWKVLLKTPNSKLRTQNSGFSRRNGFGTNSFIMSHTPNTKRSTRKGQKRRCLSMRAPLKTSRAGHIRACAHP